MTISKQFAWTAIDETQLELLVFEIAKAKGAVRTEFRKGPADKGRDVQAWFRVSDPLGAEREEVYFFEVKHHVSGVSPDHLASALAWAQAELPHGFVVVASSHITNACRANLTAWGKNNPRVKVQIWERPQLEEIILSNSALRDCAVSIKLLPSSIRGLLPDQPERYRPSEAEAQTGFEMAFRYWLTEEELDGLEHAAKLIEICGEIFEDNGLSKRYFEIACLAVNNWPTSLRLLQAQFSLQLAIRDYLFAQVSGADSVELARLGELVQGRVRVVSETGENSYHAD